MLKSMQHLEVDGNLIPRCPECGRIMIPWVQDNTFLQGEKWQKEYDRYEAFVKKWCKKKLLLLELGVGDMTPSVIKYPFWNLLEKFPDTTLITVNIDESDVPSYLQERNIHIQEDLATFMHEINR